MKVKDLIAKLQVMNPELPLVGIHIGEYGEETPFLIKEVIIQWKFFKQMKYRPVRELINFGKHCYIQFN